MKRQTIVNYIRSTATPYPTIIERAVNDGWAIEKDTTVKTTRMVMLVNEKETPIIIWYDINKPTAAMFTCTSLRGVV